MQEKAGRQREISRPTGCPKLPHPTLANSPSQQETLLSTTREKAKVPLEAKGIQPSPDTAPDMETQDSNVLGHAAGPTALLPRSRELTGRPCGRRQTMARAKMGHLQQGKQSRGRRHACWAWAAGPWRTARWKRQRGWPHQAGSPAPCQGRQQPGRHATRRQTLHVSTEKCNPRCNGPHSAGAEELASDCALTAALEPFALRQTEPSKQRCTCADRARKRRIGG